MEEQKYSRNLVRKISNTLEYFPAVILLGARQVGKTTISKMIRGDWKYFDLQNPRVYERIISDPVLFFQQNSSNLILDEAQAVPVIFDILRGIIDLDRSKKNRFIITGSSSPDLLKNSLNTLAGRAAMFEIGSLKSNEFYDKKLSNIYSLMKDKKTKREDFLNLKPVVTLNDINEFWFVGGYPEASQIERSDERSMWYHQYYMSYIEKDISYLFPNINKDKFRRFIRVLAKMSGNILNKSDIATALEISEPTVTDYLNIADGVFVWNNLFAYENSAIKNLTKMPKGYIRDSGLLNSLNNISTDSIEDLYTHHLVGTFFECFAIEEVIKGIQASDIVKANYSYYRTYSKAEIDLIIEGDFGTIPIEIKYSSNPKKGKLKTLENFVEKHGLNYGIVITQADEPYLIGENIVQIPINYF